MDPVLVHCSSCERAWHSVTMADGLRAIGSCPRCSGTLVFAAAAPATRLPSDRVAAEPATEPHLVLGVPRR